MLVNQDAAIRRIAEPARSTPVIAEPDVLVVGGGPAGVAAAAGAAGAGASVLLVECYGFLGGMWTGGLVTTLAGFNSWLKPYSRCVRGAGLEWLRRAAERGLAEDNDSWVLNSDPEGMKLVADEMLAHYGVTSLLHTWCASAIVDDGTVTGVTVENVEGRAAILARVTIDCTGNGDVVARSGAGWVKGDTLQPMTMPMRIGGVNLDPARPHFADRRIPVGPEPATLSGDLLLTSSRARADVDIDYADMRRRYELGELPTFGGPWLGGMTKDIVWFNTTRVVGDASIASEISAAEIKGRADCFRIFDYFRQHVPGMQHAHLVQCSPQIGIRETRRLVGRYTLTGDDIRASRRFDDAIGLGCWPIDIHPTGDSGYHELYAPRPYQIPYRALLPSDVRGLLVAGRCLSADREALASIRVGATCCATGHAAGVAAALAARRRVDPADLDHRAIHAELEAQNAIIEPPSGGG